MFFKVFSNKNSFKWALYDWANSVFGTSVIAGFFPIVLRNYWGKDLPPQEITFYLGTTNSLISLSVLFLAPAVGYLIDWKITNPHRLLFLFASLGSLFTACFGFIGESQLLTALLAFYFSFICFALGNTSYDSILVRVAADSKESQKLSSQGFLMGYLGGGVLLLLHGLLLIFYKELGFESTLMPVKIVFWTTGLWWIGFSLPLWNLALLPKDDAGERETRNFIKLSWRFFKSLDKPTKLFLLSYFLYIDVIYTTYKMAVDFGLGLGLNQQSLIGMLLYVQFIAAPGTWLVYKLSEIRSPIFAIVCGLLAYGVVFCFSPFVTTISHFMVMATLVGLAQGGIQALSRSHFANLIPRESQGIGFGLMNLVGKMSAIVGPVIVGLMAYATETNRWSFIVLTPLLVFGIILFLKSTRGQTGQTY